MASDSEKLEIIRSLYEHLERRNMDSYMEYYADDVVWIEPEGSKFGGTYHGKDTVRELLTSAFTTHWENFHVEPERFIDAGETIVVIATENGTYRETGKKMSARSAHVYDFEDGEIARMESFVDSAVMQEAVEQ